MPKPKFVRRAFGLASREISMLILAINGNQSTLLSLTKHLHKILPLADKGNLPQQYTNGTQLPNATQTTHS